MTITYEYEDALYVNLTNKCNCNCEFCLRHGKAQGSIYTEDSLWLVDQLKEKFGEKLPPVRINTNGHANLIQGRDVCPELKGRIDTLSISLNAITPEPFRGKRNDSGHVHLVAETIARVKGMDPEEVARITLENGKRFFGIEG